MSTIYSTHNSRIVAGQVNRPVAFMLPHEVLSIMVEVSESDILFDRSALDRTCLEHLQRAEASMGLSETQRLLALSLWGDGVPHSWDRTSSVEVWTWGLPGVQRDPWRSMRIPFTALPAELIGPRTQHQILQIWSWSMKHLFLGVFPNSRPGGEAWHASDASRRQKAGGRLGLHAICAIVKGDWKCFFEVYHLPGWHGGEEASICWRCRCTKGDLLSTGHGARMFSEDQRLGHWDLLARLQETGRLLSPIFACPFFVSDCFRLDWLHICDKGVAPWFLSGLFTVTLTLKAWGQNKQERLKALWLMLQTFYQEEKVADRINVLKDTMIDKKLASLGAAEARALVPFGSILTERWAATLPSLSAEQVAASEAMKHLRSAYDCLHVDHWPEIGKGRLLDAAIAFHALLVSLHQVDPDKWVLKPKHHLFLELAWEKVPPQMSWTYREESHGGSVSHQTHRRGGVASALSMSTSALQLFCARERFPRLVAGAAEA